MAGHPPRIAVLTSYWSTNIGNAFFQIGGAWAIQRVLPNAHVIPIGDQPGYWNVRRGNPRNALDLVANLDLDAVVVLGPFCRPEMEGITGAMLRRQRERGAKIIVLAAGMMQYDEDTVKLSRRILKEVRPFIFTTRDTETYEALGDLAEHAYDGIDVATFVSDAFRPVPVELPPYLTFNFDQIPEPRIAPAGEFGPRRASDRAVSFTDGSEWLIRQPRLRTELAYRSRGYLFLEALSGIGAACPESVAGRLVVRTDHRYNPFLMQKCYRAPNSYAGDVPYSYLNLYAHTECTFTNRVHAAVATVSYGKPAMLFSRSPRAYLLKRLGLTDIQSRPVQLDPGWLRREKLALLNWLSAAFRTCGWEAEPPSVLQAAATAATPP
jgi:hypothetical protein